MNREPGEIFDRQLASRHESQAKLEQALEKRSLAQSRLSTFLAGLAVRRAERAVLTKQARILEPMPTDIQLDDSKAGIYH